MRHIEFRKKMSEDIAIQFTTDPLPRKYALTYAKSEIESDISLVIKDCSSANDIPTGIYHFKHVDCTCDPQKRDLFYRIQTVFRRVSSRNCASASCNLHSLNYDVLLESNNFFGNIKPKSKSRSQLISNPLPHKYPLIYAESERAPDLSLVIRDSYNQNQIPANIYNFNHISCTCPNEKKGLFHRIRSVFRKKSLQNSLSLAPCNLHSLHHDIFLQCHSLAYVRIS